MNQLILFADIASDLAETARSTAEKFGFDWPHFVAQVINFLIVSGVLVIFAYKPILTVLEERRKRIADGLANAEKIKHELARTEAARLEVLNQANVQANKLIDEARAAAEQIIAKAREAAAQDHARMLAELKREVGRLVVATTAKVTGKVLTVEDQQRLAEETNRQLAA